MMQKERTNTIDVESDSFIEFVLNISAFAKRHSKNITIIANQGDGTTKINIDYRSLEFNESVTFPFSIPSGYEEIVIE